MNKFKQLIIITICSVFTTPLLGQDFSSAWLEIDQQEKTQVMEFAEEFKDFMAVARSELWFVREGVELAEAEGFQPWSPDVNSSSMQPGSRWYAINRDRTLVLFIIGNSPITDGIRIVNTHIDSPRLEFKTIPFRDRNGVVTIDTQVHGGIKNYQWVNIPLGIIGRVDKTDGSTVWVEIGMDADDPILLITDLAPHVDDDYRDRTQRDVIATEELEPIIASLPVANDSQFDMPSDRLLAILNDQYGIASEDLLSADLQIIPVTQPRDVGLDRALVAAYGQDDRSTAYVSLRAIADVGIPEQTVFAYAVNNEETRSWNTGVNSEWFNTLIAELINSTTGSFSDLDLRRTYAQTKVLVSDTTTALNPLFPSPQNPVLTSRLGYGLVVKEYGPGREANSEFFAYIRGVFDDANIKWQTHSYDAGYGGGTIAAWFAGQNMDVIDVGIGIVSMHSPYELSSKIDLWELYGGFKAFYEAEL
ncbi:aminopeptidase 1 [Haliea sp. AH-315-K21]|uniref:M18 family aminopeptidase n=1 Tax=SAR86 cluster bacterium TaxID=2030880 RepID=A0A2A5CJ38_9GAMM|nr:aminopeptidase 1 [Haliea sp. AH-315-K21]MBN4075607.1 aminopeptidase 1 [Gammaproteobacteria bacterium AH-315-E17]PCJ43386.1 MAG: peptidase M18 [SAR86 cluster bacterium]